MSTESKNWRHAAQIAFVDKWQDPLTGQSANEVLALIARFQSAMALLAEHDRDEEGKKLTAIRSLEALQHVGFEFDEQLKPLLDKFAGGSSNRLLLTAMLHMARTTISPQARCDPHCLLIPLPAPYVDFLLEQLRALEHGDRKTIFQPEQTGKHGDAYKWAKAREEAVLHVMYLHGSGKTKLSARKTVGNAIGASKNTLRDWEREASEFDLLAAHEAGKIEQDRLDLGTPRPSPIDAHALAMIERLRGQLPRFARYYKETYSGRHWGGDGD